MTTPLSLPRWRKSSHSGNGGECVETAVLDGTVGVRDSKNPAGPVLTLTGDDWATLLATLKSVG
ncbi:DUF397 domain-containing protein [Spirillospora sp. NBC_01491]|uniref:DUF397 domain-containing protein n=1 Tax=Spirillospora sp. NBC_01491 TaxID=2976007 RepID=UPI002E2F7D0E|nr:DUF397 domain-containing protein [Spirillospora sp. NBC_01491]